MFAYMCCMYEDCFICYWNRGGIGQTACTA